MERTGFARLNAKVELRVALVDYGERDGIAIREPNRETEDIAVKSKRAVHVRDGDAGSDSTECGHI
jgi:hypothetical protein